MVATMDVDSLKRIKHRVWVNSPTRLARVARQLRGHRWHRTLSLHPTTRFEGRGSHIGPHVRILGGCVILGPGEIGANTFINEGVYIDGKVTIGRDCAIGPGVRILTQTHEMGPAEHRAGAWVLREVTVGDGCWIGASATILPGVTVGAGAVIGAGSLVRDDVPANTLVVGSPARAVRRL